MTDFDPITVLVVDDDPDARELMQAILEQRGMKVVAAESVSRAFELLEVTPPHVIISDIAMPEEDGVGFVQRLRMLPIENLAKIPAIAVSAYVAASDRTRALTAGFDRYLHKPVDFDELIANIRSVMQRQDNKASA